MRTRQQRSARGGVDAGGDSAEALASPSPQAATPSPPRVVPTPQRWAHDQVDLQPTRCKGGVGMLGRAQWLPLPRKAVYELLCRSDVGATRWQRRAGVGACTCNLIPCSGPCPPPPCPVLHPHLLLLLPDAPPPPQQASCLAPAAPPFGACFPMTGRGGGSLRWSRRQVSGGGGGAGGYVG